LAAALFQTLHPPHLKKNGKGTSKEQKKKLEKGKRESGER
jgi:hypothetical protein